MDVVNQALNNGFAALQEPKARTNSLAKFALNHRVDCFGLPALPIEAIQSCLSDQIHSRLALRVSDSAVAANRWHKVKRRDFFGIKALVAQEKPSSLALRVKAVAFSLGFQAPQKDKIRQTTGLSAAAQNQETLRANGISTLHPFRKALAH